MTNAAKATRGNEDEILEGREQEQKPEEEKAVDFSDFANAVEVSPAIEKIMKNLYKENIKDKQEFLKRAWDLAADELVAMVKARKEGPEIDQLLDFQEKINKILEKNGAVGDQKEEDCLPGGICQGIDLDETVNLRKKK